MELIRCKGKTLRESDWYEMEEKTVGNVEV